MKLFNKPIPFVLSFLIGSILLSGCSKNDPTPVSDQDAQLVKLAQTWKIKTVTHDGPDVTNDYKNFVLTISGTSGASSFAYSTSGRPTTSPWRPNGTWVFGADVFSDVIRDKDTADEVASEYSVSESELLITFDFSGTGYQARTSVVKGKWIFTFTK